MHKFHYFRRIFSGRRRVREFAEHERLRPSAAFVAKTRARFLQAFREVSPEELSMPVRRTPAFAGGFASGLALAVLVSSGAVYANEEDVAPSHALYPLKRAHEFFVLTLSSESEKPLRYLRLAERRLGEIETMKRIDPLHAIIPELRVELEEAVAHSLPTLEEAAATAVTADEPEVSSLTPLYEDNRGEHEGRGGRKGKSGGEEVERTAAPLRVQVVTSVPQAAEEIAPPEIFLEEKVQREEEEQEEQESRDASLREGRRRGKGLSGERIRICSSWDLLLQSDSPEARGAVKAHEKLLEKFEKHCGR
jgi:hypothetical protein